MNDLDASPVQVTVQMPATGSSTVHLAYERDDTYYCKELVVAVENKLFRVPKAIFEQSEAFQDMFSVPQAENEAVEGSDDEHPLVLEGYLAHDFKQLLRVLLPLQYGFSTPLTSDEWLSVLKLSSIWGFHAVKNTAVEKLSDFALDDPILKIIVAKKYDVASWFIPGMNMLAQRKDPLTYEEVSRFKELGSMDFVLDFALKISRVREAAATGSSPALPVSNIGYACSLLYCNTHQAYTSCQVGRAGAVVTKKPHDMAADICATFGCDLSGEPKAGSVTDASDLTATSLVSKGKKKKKGTRL